jgi:hypothetical protein
VQKGGVDEILDDVLRSKADGAESMAVELRARQEGLERASVTGVSAGPGAAEEESGMDGHDDDDNGDVDDNTFLTSVTPMMNPIPSEEVEMLGKRNPRQTPHYHHDPSSSSSSSQKLHFDKEKLRQVIAVRNSRTEAFSKLDPVSVSGSVSAPRTAAIRGSVIAYKAKFSAEELRREQVGGENSNNVYY